MSDRTQVISSDDGSMTVPEPGLKRQVMSFNQHMMLVRHTMAPGWVGARHSHPHEQLVYIVSGEIELTVAGARHLLRAGDSILVHGGVEHQAVAESAAEVLDVFAPCRDDYTSR